MLEKSPNSCKLALGNLLRGRVETVDMHATALAGVPRVLWEVKAGRFLEM